MALNWNEIRDRAVRFSKLWEDTVSEDAEAKSFLDAFFDVFGIPRKKIGTFEHRIKKLDEGDGYIDMLWKGHILIEMKSRGKDLDKAFQQAKDYTHGLKQEELPKYILISDFHHFRLYDTEEMSTNEFTLPELYKNVGLFGYLIGVSKKVYKEQDPANIKAAELMGKLHDRLEEIGYEGHPLEVYLVRILFCLFAEDTSIFEKQQFQDFLEQRTNEDGSDLAARLQELFQVLNTDKDKRFKNLDEQLNDFPYVNGKLFEESLPTASFDSKMRKALLDCCYIDWSKISPAIFGSMFQSVMNPKERRNLGAHYTSEKNILKLIKPLFLDELWTEFESLKGKKNELPKFHQKLSTLHFLDPACGCGNFLVITYRELRLLEIAVLRDIYKNQLVTNVESVIWIDVDQFYGIEYEEFPARIAEVAMWLIDHQMNMLISYEFGEYFARLPLKKAAKIVHGNALRLDWEDVVSKDKLSFVIGNPPFLGHHMQNENQKFLSAKEYLNSINRWVIWLVDADPKELKEIPLITERIELVKKFRSESIAASTREYKFHSLFRQVTQPKSDFLLVPRTTSENRTYIPIGFYPKDYIVSDTCQSIPNANFYHFGVLTSLMHMAWVKTVCGRLKSDYRYSKDIVYNNFPWPENPTEKQRQSIEDKAQKVLDVRAQFPDSSLADLYDPLTMPPALVKAHNDLDKAVDLAYRSQPFTSEANRMEFLFGLYEKYTADLFTVERKKGKKK